MIKQLKSSPKSQKERSRVKRYMDEKFGTGFLRSLALDSFESDESPGAAELIPVRVETTSRR